MLSWAATTTAAPVIAALGRIGSTETLLAALTEKFTLQTEDQCHLQRIVEVIAHDPAVAIKADVHDIYDLVRS